MLNTKHKASKKQFQPGRRRRFILPGLFLGISFLLMILPLDGFVSSVKAVLSYVFIPQIRLAHSTVKYAGNVSQTVRELLDTHHENHLLKQELEMNRMLVAQAETVFQENERLAAIIRVAPQKRWEGVWAKVAYREPTQWNTVIIDKGSADGIAERSAVLSLEEGQEGLAGVVVEVTENTSKVLLVRDEDFSAAVQLADKQEEGLLQGGGLHPVRIKYIPLLSQVQPGETVYTAASSSIFPAGILVGKVSAVRREESFQTALTVEVEPLVRSAAAKELFVILQERK